jgi:nucleotide-binding universal stress UspA family protein
MDMVRRVVIRPVVVGVDGSPEAMRAVAWAAAEAHRRGLPLRVVHALAFVPTELPLDRPPSRIGAMLQEEAELAVHAAVELVRHRVHGLTVTSVLVPDAPGPVLVRESEKASLLVVGVRGRGGFAGLLLGSVSQHVAAHAHCPVVVVRGGPYDESGAGQSERAAPAGVGAPRFDTVVVGVDSSTDEALRFGFEAAASRGARLRVVHCWSPPIPFPLDPPRPQAMDLAELSAERYRRLTDLVHPWREKHPDVEVRLEVVPAVPVNGLVAASAEADLLVVAARRHAHRLGRILGPVVHGMLRHAYCPVAVVRERDGNSEPD